MLQPMRTTESRVRLLKRQRRSEIALIPISQTLTSGAPILSGSQKAVEAGKTIHQLKKNPARQNPTLNTKLNFLNCIAIGV
ncbi:hypothetical protein C1752_09710 [Acaryochloris thomasi RCC1774]|uniref:Uncharacterized protein n=1 Tax=Acaryochloris thomasi RCC1774 TaxID=1764569 RepID=A0A2W1JNC1_9CYAN|nr:hypothetical protein C1752_09710 [Acaryochloris thomasi RCC1774]